MKKLSIIAGLLISILLPQDPAMAEQNPDCKILEQIFKTKVEAAGKGCRVEIIRKNMEVTRMGKKLSPEIMDLVYDFAFEKVDGHTVVMGEMALLQSEVNAVVDELRKGGMEITAIHNHMLHERPRVIYLHFQGTGDIVQESNTLINAIAVTKELKQLQQSAGPLN